MTIIIFASFVLEVYLTIILPKYMHTSQTYYQRNGFQLVKV